MSQINQTNRHIAEITKIITVAHIFYPVQKTKKFFVIFFDGLTDDFQLLPLAFFF